LIARQNDFGGVDVCATVAQQLLASLEIRAFGDVTLVFKLNLRLSDGEERVVLVALVVEVLAEYQR
jgi:hypothetical protein